MVPFIGEGDVLGIEEGVLLGPRWVLDDKESQVHCLIHCLSAPPPLTVLSLLSCGLVGAGYPGCCLYTSSWLWWDPVRGLEGQSGCGRRA